MIRWGVVHRRHRVDLPRTCVAIPVSPRSARSVRGDLLATYAFSVKEPPLKSTGSSDPALNYTSPNRKSR